MAKFEYMQRAFSSELKPRARLVLQVLVLHCNKEGECFPSNGVFRPYPIKIDYSIILHTLLLSFKGNIHHLSTRKKCRKVTDILAYVEKSFNLKKTVSVSKCFARLSDICAKYPGIY